MNSNSTKHGSARDLDEAIEEDPEAKHGDEGESAHGGDQAGPNSSRAGQPIAPQPGDPRAGDRTPN